MNDWIRSKHVEQTNNTEKYIIDYIKNLCISLVINTLKWSLSFTFKTTTTYLAQPTVPYSINPSRMKHKLLHLMIQFAPRSKHSPACL